MKTTTSIVLAAVAAGLVLFIVFWERDCATTDDREERSDRVLPDFSRDAVDRIVLGEGDERIELTRASAAQPDAGPVGSVGNWHIGHPMEVEADQEAVDNLLSAIDWLERRRQVEEQGAADREQFGLSEPRARVTFRLRGRDVTLLLGADAPGESLYLAVEGEGDRVFAVDREFLDDVTPEVGEVRSKRLARIRVPVATAVRVKGRFHVTREAPMRWRLRTPIDMRADTTVVESVLRDLERLRAKRFVADDVAEDGLGRYGLDAPRQEVAVRLEGDEELVTLRFGAVCEGHGDEIYATALGSGTVACVEQEVLAGLAVETDTLRDMRATRLRVSAIDGVTLVGEGRQVDLERQGDDWRIGAEEEDDEVDADTESVEDLIDALRDAAATEVVTELPATLAGDEPEPDLEIRLRLTEDEGEGAEILRFAMGGDRILLRRGSEAVALALPADLAGQLSTEAIRFRDRRVIQERPSEAVALEITAGANQQVLRRPETLWRVVEPVEGLADDTVVREVVRALSTLRAERFAAPAPIAAHGLTRPRITVQIRFEQASLEEGDGGAAADAGEAGARERTLLIGAETEGGAFARLAGDDEAVFVIDDALVDRLGSPLIDRDLFSFDEDVIQSVLIERGGDRFELAREGSEWHMGGEAAPSSARVDRILTRLAVVRAAEAVGYGAPRADMGFGTPRARVVLGLEDDDDTTPEELVILVGAEYGEGDDRRVYARREGVDATLGLPPRAVELILEFGTGDTE